MTLPSVRHVLSRLLFLVAGLSLVSAVYASAAHLVVSSKTLGSGSAIVPKCSASSWTLSPQYTASLTVTGVIIQIPSSASACNGDTINVTARASSSFATGTGAAVAPGSALTISFSACTGALCGTSPVSLPAPSVGALYASIEGA